MFCKCFYNLFIYLFIKAEKFSISFDHVRLSLVPSCFLNFIPVYN